MQTLLMFLLFAADKDPDRRPLQDSSSSGLTSSRPKSSCSNGPDHEAPPRVFGRDN